MSADDAAPAAPASPCIKALFLDFDSTISTPIFLQRANMWCVADNVELFRSMSPEEIVANFGGSERIEVIKALLTDLSARGVVLYIVSIGHKVAIMPHLHRAGLLTFFEPKRIFGQDCAELRNVNFVKGVLIDQLMKKEGLMHGNALFVDDSLGHIEKASSVCRTLLVESKHTVGGMAEPEFRAIRAAAGLDMPMDMPNGGPTSQ